MSDIILDIHNVKQKNKVMSIIKNPNFSSDLRKLIIDQNQEELNDGKIKITLILDPKIKEINNE